MSIFLRHDEMKILPVDNQTYATKLHFIEFDKS